MDAMYNDGKKLNDKTASEYDDSYIYCRHRHDSGDTDSARFEVEQRNSSSEEWRKRERIKICDWIDEDDDDDEESGDDFKGGSCQDRYNNRSGNICTLESLPIEVSAAILSHLSVQEIASVALVSSRLASACRSNKLWKHKFQARWNVQFTQNWYEAYKQAYHNPHDLWITHLNCVFPNDGLSPGRCCILHPSRSYKRSSTPACEDCHDGDGDNVSESLCPSCRYFQMDFSSVSDELDINSDNSSSRKTNEKRSGTGKRNRPPTKAKKVAQATQRTIQKLCHTYKNLPKRHYSSKKAARAFQQAGTFHRSIDTQQYVAASNPLNTSVNSLNFLTDLLFFNTEQQQQPKGGPLSELHHLKREMLKPPQRTNSASTSTSNSPTVALTAPDQAQISHHTWHIASFTNPDFSVPIVFRIYIQRRDCFTVFPSEGCLAPGQTITVVFGVRPLGALIAKSFEELNMKREGVADPDLIEVYADQAHLPFAPFCIRYKYAHIAPCIPEGFKPPFMPANFDDAAANTDNNHQANNNIRRANNNNRWNNTARTTTATRISTRGTAMATDDQVQFSSHTPNRDELCEERKQLFDLQWGAGDIVEKHQVRNIFLSAHVHANYDFWEFLRGTLVPWQHLRNDNPSVYTAPQLREFNPHLYDRLQRIKLETEESHAGHEYRTEQQKCSRCSTRSWGVRFEELGHAYVLGIFECLVYRRLRNNLLRNVVRCLRTVVRFIEEKYKETGVVPNNTNRVQPLLYKIHEIVQRYRAAPWISHNQNSILTSLEIAVDQVYFSLGNMQDEAQGKNTDTEDSHVPWRYAGLYRYPNCSQSVFEVAVEDDGKDGIGNSHYGLWKDEPDYLDAFRHLAYHPGRFCLGQQEDPNHLDESKQLNLVPSKQRRYHRRQKGLATDIFMDDPIRAFQSALCMLYDPRCLMVHGIYDRVPYPGSVIRRPKMPFLSPNDVSLKGLVQQKPASPIKSNFTNINYLQLQDALDLDSISREFDEEGRMGAHTDIGTEGSFSYPLSLIRYLRNIPSPGVGRFPLSRALENDSNISGGTIPVITDLVLDDGDDARLKKPPSVAAEESESPPPSEIRPGMVIENHGGGPPLAVNGEPPPLGMGNVRGPRFLNFLWMLSAQLGWTVEDGNVSVFVDRRLLISVHWISISLVLLPLSWTLFARYAQWIPTKPLKYHLDDLPYELNNEMRFLSEHECGYVALILVFLWMILGRWSERRTKRDFFRAMLEHQSTTKQKRLMWGKKASIFTRWLPGLSLWVQRRWDSVCPLFLQRLVFAPHWNRRSQKDLLKHIAFWRSKDFREHRSMFKAVAGRGLMCFDHCDGDEKVDLENDSSTKKLLVSILVAIGSFMSSSPHFWLNFLIIFSCSISLGLSMSLHSMETGRSGLAVNSTGPLLKSLNLVTAIILSLLIGQLLGSSGGVLFLAEFIVTSVSLILGGAGTISASSVESWGCFFCLSSTAFWGYLFGRVGLDNIRRTTNQTGVSSAILCWSLAIVGLLWLAMLLVWRWETPVDLLVIHPNLVVRDNREIIPHKFASKYLQ